MVQKKIISIHQPNYIPWLGYFYKIAQSDIFVFHDDAMFSESGMHQYHYIKTPQGPFRLKIPVEQKHGDKIMEVRTRDELGWKNKQLKIIEHNYKKAKFFELVFSDFSNLLLKEYPTLAMLNQAIIIQFCDKLGIDVEYVNSSDLNLTTTREEKIFDTCNRLGANIYYSGTGAKAYQNEENFINRGIELRYSSFTPFEYPQLWGEFQSNVTILDYLMNCGYDWGRVLEHQQHN
ncbi:MAG: WbqC family protein [Bacteroidales bacterium]|nr:WbqC family protein [Bacteroidales bacterium]